MSWIKNLGSSVVLRPYSCTAYIQPRVIDPSRLWKSDDSQSHKTK